MKPEKLLNLIEKLQLNTISQDELEYLQNRFQSKNDIKVLIKLLQQEYQKSIHIDKGQVKFENQILIKDRLIKNTLPTVQSTIKKNRIIYYVACIIVIVSIFSSVYYLKTKSYDFTDISNFTIVNTIPGERKKITLNDGSYIILNGNSQLLYQNTDNKAIRLVQLNGEAYFNINPNKSKPFLVVTNNFSTEVVGTSFNILTDYDSSIKVTDGKVNIYNVDSYSVMKSFDSGDLKNNPNKYINAISNEKISLSKGEKASKNQNNKWIISQYSLKNWNNNEFIYVDQPITYVLKDIYRNFGDSISIAPSLESKRITITIENKNLNQILNTLTELCDGKLIKDPKNNNWQIIEN